MSGWRHRGAIVYLYVGGGDKADKHTAPAAEAARRMACTNMYGAATVACRVCYRDQHGTPHELSCTPQRKWVNGYHLTFRLCQTKPSGGGRPNGSLPRRGWDVSCCSCNGSCETKECDSSEDGAGPYRYVLTTSQPANC